jgi:dTDP-4-dehydrorhamnose reductase
MELWAGAECSVVRVGDSYVDQIAKTGHDARDDDLDRLAALGVRAVRVPVLWERTAPDGPASADWSWSDRTLARARSLGLRPIVGLVHHGSGPRGTSLLVPTFASGLAEFARAVAARYPWVRDWTPVNEPVTTARFSALYGHWYPHARSGAAFARALVHESCATRDAMRAVREHVPDARLVQTEDIGTIVATPRLAYQARYENVRRFASLDLLTGRLGPGHRLYREWIDVGIDAALLADFARAPCPPDVVGVNYYVTSDRFLDDAASRYPPHARGGNEREAYADVEAVRGLGAGIFGHRRLLSVLWRRYGLPLAITEVHLGCAPEEQVRWLAEAWAAAESAREAGVDVRAVTLWSAFGAVDWDSLLVEARGHYEPGAFDVRDGRTRPTALAQVARELAASGRSTHPALELPGWWRRPERLAHPRHGRLRDAPLPNARPILVTGKNGLLGSAIGHVIDQRALPSVVLGRAELDLSDPGAVGEALDRLHPWAVVNAAGSAHVDLAETDRARFRHEHAIASEALAAACAARGVRLAWFSSDLVFDGRKNAPYVEDDPVAPLSVYGASKVEGEQRVLAACPDALVVRTSAFFGPWDAKNFVTRTLAQLERGARVPVADDTVVSPTYVPDLAHAVLTLLVDGATGVWHIANAGALTWHELACRAARAARVPAHALVPCATKELGLAARRPSYSALATRRGARLADIDDALERYARAVASPSVA